MTGTPFIPEYITVHLGRPEAAAENVTVSFPQYVKNVASSEIYPTWPEAAIRANMYAQISFALNRVYNEWYRSRGYDFDITNSTAFDQSFVKGRNIFENISQIADEVFNDYIRRQGFVEPLFAVYCDGIEVQCNGLSQWGSVELADQGYVPYDILTNYYGDNINIVFDAPIQAITDSYPGTPVRLASVGGDVRRIQNQLNRISRNYPGIPKIVNPDGIFGVETEDAVRQFQSLFNLTDDGIVGKATWYQIQYVYTSVKRLAEVDSEGQSVEDIAKQYKNDILEGDTGDLVRGLQYYLSLINVFNNSIPPVNVDGVFGTSTRNAVESFQRYYGLPVTGVVDEETWTVMSDIYLGMISEADTELLGDRPEPYPGVFLREGMSGESVRLFQTYISRIADNYPNIPKVTPTGYFGPETQRAVIAFQEEFGLSPRGTVGPITWNAAAELYDDLVMGEGVNPGQFAGELSEEG